MATLTTPARKRIPASGFGLPKTRQYPIEDKAHARNALARAAQQLKAGHLTRAQYAEIARRADRVLGR